MKLTPRPSNAQRAATRAARPAREISTMTTEMSLDDVVNAAVTRKVDQPQPAIRPFMNAHPYDDPGLVLRGVASFADLDRVVGPSRWSVDYVRVEDLYGVTISVLFDHGWTDKMAVDSDLDRALAAALDLWGKAAVVDKGEPVEQSRPMVLNETTAVMEREKEPPGTEDEAEEPNGSPLCPNDGSPLLMSKRGEKHYRVCHECKYIRRAEATIPVPGWVEQGTTKGDSDE